MPKFIFFDTNKDIVNAYKNTLRKIPNTRFVQGEIQNISRNYKIDYLVSPANSFGFMDGGIDRVYMVMFDNIQTTVQNFIKNFGLKTNLKRDYIPIGSAFYVPVRYLYGHPQVCHGLISAPTMFFPQSVKGSKNVYYAFLAILQLTKNWKNNVVIGIPGLGTGVGEVSSQDCADQVYKAFKDFYNGTYRYPKGTKIYRGNNYYILSKMACPQKDLYCNNEIPK
jgi:O-acetyl-ADP-ribose deacetylase (regulator of RNase III)